jgi:hypothetical protein
MTAARRRDFTRVRDVVRRHLPAGYEEVVSGPFLVWQVPLSEYSDTYNGNPFQYVALASQKSYLALYMVCAYAVPSLATRIRKGFDKAGKRLDMGRSCIRFRTADDLALDVIGEVVAATPMQRWIEIGRKTQGR